MKKPKIVVLCGSSKFVDIMAVCAWLIERDENAIAMGLHLLPFWYVSSSGQLPPDHLAEHENCSSQMDLLHMAKIDISDEVFVVDYQGYLGISTRNEINYARKNGKPIRLFREDPIGAKVSEIIWKSFGRH